MFDRKKYNKKYYIDHKKVKLEPIYRNREWLYNKYTEEELSTREVAKLCGASYFTINCWLKKFNIHMHPQNEGMLGKHHSRETKRKYSEVRKGHLVSEETRKKISKGNVGNTKWLGKHHSEESKKKMRKRIVSKETKEKMSKAQVGKIPNSIQIAGNYGYIKRGWYDINGKNMFFRSKWEVNYALYLDFLIKQKQIKKWTYEKDIFIFEKIKYGTRSYIPDFKIYNNDSTIEYHEVKGWMNPRSKTQLKRMAKYYPDIKLIIIDKDVYSDIKIKLGKMLKFY